jgi:hypothetical protein
MATMTECSAQFRHGPADGRTETFRFDGPPPVEVCVAMPNEIRVSDYWLSEQDPARPVFPPTHRYRLLAPPPDTGTLHYFYAGTT